MEHNKKKNILRQFGEIILVIAVLVGFAAIMNSLFGLPWKPYQKASVDPYDGVVCMHGVDVKVADYDAEHICEHMAVLRSEDTYTPKFKFDEVSKIEIEPARLEMIKAFVRAIEDCKESTYIFELSGNGIDDWSAFEKDVRVYCAEFYDVNDRITGMLGDTWSTEANGRSYIELDIQHCKEVIELCRQEEARRIITEAAIKEDVSHLDLNGYKVHDLKIIHDYICNNTTYDWELSNTTVYEFFTEDAVQCSGYTRTFEMICNYVGLDVKYVSGSVGTELHAWNSVVIDGETYYIDCTWDDNSDISYEYFLTKEPSGVVIEEVN
jgi:hypothetical protein